MTAHQPFPIADMDVGMYLAKEPWLSPNNAFAEMKDAHVFRSRVHRRSGFDRFSSCGVASASSVTEIDNAPYYTYQLDTATTKFTPESVELQWNDPVNGLIDANVAKDAFGLRTIGFTTGWFWDVVETGTTNVLGFLQQPYVLSSGPTNVPASVTVNWSLHSDYTGLDAGKGALTAWSEDPELPIVGMRAYKTTDGTEFLVAINTTRIFLYNTTRGWFDDSVGSDSFTGASSDLFWVWPLDDDLLITNGVDRVKKYNGPTDTLSNMGTTIGAGPSVIDSAQLVIFYRNRVIYLNISEGSTTYPRRGRWSRAGAYETLDVEDFADAPTELGSIVTVEYIADRIMVGFQRGWMELVYTADPQDLFRWEKTTSIYGANAKLSSIADGARILSRTENGIAAIDPNNQYAADVAIPDYIVDQLDAENAGVTYGIRNIPMKQLWWTTTSSVSATDNADGILVAQYQEDEKLRWSRYLIGFNCFADFRSESSANWDDIDEDWNDYDTNWDSSSNLIGFPVTLAGHASGTIYRVGASKDHIDFRPYSATPVQDYALVGPQAIPFEITTVRLSPFPGFESHLGWVDFYMDAAEDVVITVEFRGNSRPAAYKIDTFSIAPSGANEKVYRRLRVNKKALFHTITIKAETGGKFSIDAIIPWFRPAGRMKEFG